MNRTDAASEALTTPVLFNNHQCLNTKEALSYLANGNHNCFGKKRANGNLKLLLLKMWAFSVQIFCVNVGNCARGMNSRFGSASLEALSCL